MGMTAWVVAVDQDTNEITYSGLTSEFELVYSAYSIESSKMKLHKNKCKSGDIVAFNLVSGHGNIKRDNRCDGNTDGLNGPAFYYGTITATGNETEVDYGENLNDEVTVSDIKYFLNFNYTVESGNWLTGNIDTIKNGESSGGEHYNDAALSFLTNVVNKWNVCSPLTVNRLTHKHYSGKVNTIRFPEPDGAGTANMTDTLKEYYSNYGIVFVPYCDMIRDKNAPRSSNDNLLQTSESKAANKTTEVNGIRFVNNANGTYTVNGKLTADEALYTLYNAPLSSTNLTIGTTYRVYCRGSQEDQPVFLQVYALIGSSKWELLIHLSSNERAGGTITIPSGTTKIWCRLKVAVKNTQIDTQAISPSIVIEGQEQPIYQTGTGTTSRGITYTNNYDGTYTLHGTCNDTESKAESLYTLSLDDLSATDFKAGVTYSCGIMPKDPGVSINVWSLVNGKWDDASSVNIEGSGGSFTIPSNATRLWIRIRVKHGTSIIQKRYRPYVCVGTNTPYQNVYGAFITGDRFGSLVIDKSKWIAESKVYDRPIMDGNPNGINIGTVNQDDNGNFSSVSVIRRYITKDRKIVHTPDDPGIVHPIKMTTYNYTPEKETKTENGKETTTLKLKSADDIAKEQLMVPLAANEISFKIHKNHPQINSILRVGNYGNIIFKRKTRESIVTKYTINSNDDYVLVECGNVRSTLQDIIHEAQTTTTTTNTSASTNTTTNVTSTGGTTITTNVEFATSADITNLVANLFSE